MKCTLSANSRLLAAPFRRRNAASCLAQEADELYFALKPGSINLGEIDYRALLATRPQDIARNPHGCYRLFRIGDAVSSRNIHAAVYGAGRLMKDV